MTTHQIVTSLIAEGNHKDAADVWAAHLSDLYASCPVLANMRAIAEFHTRLALDGPELVMAEVHEQIADAA